jgi:hypothetical protein
MQGRREQIMTPAASVGASNPTAEQRGVVARLSALAQLERRSGFFDHRVDGWSAWRVLRTVVHRRTTGVEIAPLLRPYWGRVASAVGASVHLLWVVLMGPRRDLLVKTSRASMRLRQGERFRDIFFDGLLQRSSTTFFKLEDVNSSAYSLQAANALFPADLDVVAFTFLGRILGLVFPVKESAYCRRLAGELESELGVVLKPSVLRLRLSSIYWQSKLFALFLRRIRPRVVLVAESGDFALSIACRRLGIRFIELQHGVLDNLHPDTVPEWVKGSAEELILPDVLACRGRWWIERLTGTRQGRDHCVPVGNELVDLARETQRQASQPKPDAHLVFSSQGLVPDAMSDWIAGMIAAAPPTLSWRLFIKLHPIYDAWNRAYDRFAGDARVRIVPAEADPSIYDLLVNADLHLSISSACHYDAAAFGVPSAVVPLADYSIMSDVVDDRRFFVPASPAGVWSRLGPNAAATDEVNSFSTPGFVDNMRRLIADDAGAR